IDFVGIVSWERYQLRQGAAMRRKLMVASAVLAAMALGIGTAVAQEEPTQQQVGFDFEDGQTIAQGLSIPWGLAFLPNGHALVADRNSGAVMLYKGFGSPEVLGGLGVPERDGPFDERGLLGLAVSPTYEEDGYIYAYHSTDEDNRVVRFTAEEFEPEPIITGIPSAVNHNGGRLA